jgi:hypothetical protein
MSLRTRLRMPPKKRAPLSLLDTAQNLRYRLQWLSPFSANYERLR